MTVPHVPLFPALTWLGGANSDVTEPQERAGYAVGGVAVALFAVGSAVVVALATAVARWPVWLVIVGALLTVLLLGAVSRALATAPLPGTGRTARFRGDLVGRIAIAALAGVVVAELASTVLLGGTVDRVMDERARQDAGSAPAVLTAGTELDRARAGRTALDQRISADQAGINQALIIARCEYNPSPQCPQTKITGVPGRGPETQTDNAMLGDARARLATDQGQVPAADHRVADRQQALDRARASAFHAGDRGMGARWLALNAYTGGHGAGLLLRLATIVVAVALALLPLLLRWWRGETSFDRRTAARAVADRAEQAAVAAVAVRQAQAYAETEQLRAEQQVAAARLAGHADAAIDREQQRRRIVAAIGNIEIGIAGPARRAVDEFDRATLAELPAGNEMSQEANVTQSSNLPAPRTAGALAPSAGQLAPAGARPPEPRKGGGLELPLIGTVPFTDTAARWLRPMVPSFVADAIDTATHPLRSVRQAFEEAEEITFTLRRTRKVTINSEDTGQPGYAPVGAQQPYATQAGTQILDPHSYDQHGALPTHHGRALSSAQQHDALTGRPGAAELEYRGPRQLPPGSGSE